MTTSLTIDQGDDEIIDLTVLSPTGTAADLTEWKLWFYVKKSAVDSDASALIAKTSDPSGGIDITNAVGGIAQVTIQPSDTADFPSSALGRTLQWQLQGKASDDKITTLARGEITVNRDLISTTT